MTDTALPTPLTLTSRVDQVFPTLTPAQVKRIASHGRVRRVQSGEVLLEAGEQAEHFFVVITGRIEILRPSRDAEELVAVHRTGQFSGEVSTPSGRRAFNRTVAGESG